MTDEIEKAVSEEMNDDLIPGETAKREEKEAADRKAKAAQKSYGGRNYGYGYDDNYTYGSRRGSYTYDDDFGADPLDRDYGQTKGRGFSNPNYKSAWDYDTPEQPSLWGSKKPSVGTGRSVLSLPKDNEYAATYKKLKLHLDRISLTRRGCPPFRVDDHYEVDTIFLDQVSASAADAIQHILEDCAYICFGDSSLRVLSGLIREFIVTECMISKEDRLYLEVKEME